ncbi:PH domain leucine-rich repeat-containing protein phosphatase 2-like isoform X3 [Oopsacas minuta]|uniref:PH domain leucine-rich repeat-containing protein phosphatase 2-like isoform X3 n=1 Tax=Oopsacas minuta TaxID=111878 RepID=A0AAV7JAV2_9METZ|nr:PH domain leucine-rich repeat-containing protein phosphatase 2-like isoform X3 [Oopsacas minuta]
MSETSSTFPRIITPIPSMLWWAIDKDEELNTLERGRMTAIEFFLSTAVSPDKGKVKEQELDLFSWMKGQSDRGLIRVYKSDESTSKLVQCLLSTSAAALAEIFGCETIYVQLYDDLIRRLEDIENPLEVQNQLLKQLGYQDQLRIKKEGRHSETANYIKFYSGRPQLADVEERLHLKGTFRMKQDGWMHRWEYRYCILCGSRLLIFRSGEAKGRPFVLNIYKGNVEEHKLNSNKRGVQNAVRIYSDVQKVAILIAFNSWTQYTTWFRKASKMTYRKSDELNLTSCCLENVPDHVFIHWHKHIHSLNLGRNFMRKQADPLPYGSEGSEKPLGFICDLPKFSHLRNLTLSDNELAVFPNQICDIITLKSLNLSRNVLSEISEEISRLKKLENLSLHSNQLTDLPQQLSKLNKLAILTVSFNRFSSFPDVLLMTHSLKSLVISGNNISKLPEDLKRLLNLEKLDLRLNPISGSLPDSINLMTNLNQLDITHTELDRFDSKTTPSLQLLACNSTSVRVLSLDDTAITEVVLSGGSLNTITMDTLSSNLVTLDVSRNALKELPESICDLPVLKEINVSRNLLTHLPARIFWHMRGLTKLNASANHIISLPDRIDKCLLQYLDASQNNLTTLPMSLLLRLTSLKELNLSCNQLTELPLTSDTQDMSILHLFLSNNQLTESAVAVISSYKTLVMLDLSHNGITKMADHFFAKMIDLEFVNLSGNLLTHLPSRLSTCYKLQILFAHSNRLTDIPDLSHCDSLRDLDISSNQLTSLPLAAQTYFPDLRYLDLSDNPNLILDRSCIPSLRTIKRLILEGVFDVPMVLSSMMPTGTVDCGYTSSYNYLWRFGSAEARGLGTVNSILSPTLVQHPYRIMQIKDTAYRRGKDGLFAIIEGYPTSDVSSELSLRLPNILLSEIDETSREISANYLKYAILNANKLLGKIGHFSAASIAICHIYQIPGGYILNTANVGQVEVVISRQGKPITLTQSHTVNRNATERVRVLNRRGFITEDKKVLGLSPTTRALGAFSLYPIITPDPYANSLRLSAVDEFLIIGSKGLWEFISYDLAIKVVKQFIDKPTCAAKRLRDLAIATGCQDNIAVLVVILSISSQVAGIEKMGAVSGSFYSTNEVSGLRRSGRMIRSKFEGIDLAEIGGEEVRAVHVDKHFGLKSKGQTAEGAQEYVTQADRRSHQKIVGGLKRVWPNLNVISEERDKVDFSNVKWPRMDRDEVKKFKISPAETDFVNITDLTIWVDPLDATQEYTENLLDFVTVMVCVAYKGYPLIGIVHLPFKMKTYFAWVGNGYDLPPSDYQHEDDKLRIIVSRSHAGDVEALVKKKILGDIEVIQAGGAGFKTLKVLEGQANFYIHVTKIKKWDICAPNAMLNTVKGSMTTLKGDTINYSGEDSPANNDGLFATLDKEGDPELLKALASG